jgi:hypothetical protein
MVRSRSFQRLWLAALGLGWTLPCLAQAPDPALAGYAAVLQAVVRGEGVDYALLRERHLAALEAYLARVAEIDVAALSNAERLALYINAYNATVLREVSVRFAPGYSAAADDYRLFKEPLVRLGGRSLSLDELEHGVIRKEFHEPRIHAAVVCAARSCPPLVSRPYRADELDAQLEAGMLRFLNDPQRNRVDVAGKKLALSRIFEWYAEDFGGVAALPGFVDEYIEGDVSGFAVRFLDYSWELNLPR